MLDHKECVLNVVTAVEAVIMQFQMIFISVSKCNVCKFVSRVQPVTVCSAVYCTICILFMFVSDIIVNHIVFAFSMTGQFGYIGAL